MKRKIRKEKYSIPPLIEPLRLNRFYCDIKKIGNDKLQKKIEPYRIQKVNLNQNYHEIEIIEIIGQRNVFDTVKTNEKIIYDISFLDPTGAVVKSISYKGFVSKVELSTLSYENDGVITTHIQIWNVEKLK